MRSRNRQADSPGHPAWGDPPWRFTARPLVIHRATTATATLCAVAQDREADLGLRPAEEYSDEDDQEREENSDSMNPTARPEVRPDVR